MIEIGGKEPSRIVASGKDVDRVYASGGKLVWNRCGYSTDGLLAWFDGLNNTGLGHDSSAMYWKDLSGNGHDATLLKSVPDGGWVDNGYLFKGRNEFFRISTLSMIALNPKSNPFSIEIATVRENYPLCEYNTVFTTVDDRISIYRATYNTNLTWKGPFDRPKQNDYRSGSIAATFNPANGIAVLYTDDMKSSQSTVSWWYELITNSPFTFGGSDNSHFYTGTIYAIRIYTRLLNEQEILKHHAIDMARFGLTE